jgi:hypothetical protein
VELLLVDFPLSEAALLASQRLRDVCIQDPRRQTAYLLTAEDLKQYEATGRRSGQFVTFTLTQDALFDMVPDHDPVDTAEPDVLIRDLDADVDYYVPFDSLKRHEIERPADHPVAKTYTIPMPEALVEELPSAIRALLQTDFHADGPHGEKVLRDSK